MPTPHGTGAQHVDSSQLLTSPEHMMPLPLLTGVSPPQANLSQVTGVQHVDSSQVLTSPEQLALLPLLAPQSPPHEAKLSQVAGAQHVDSSQLRASPEQLTPLPLLAPALQAKVSQVDCAATNFTTPHTANRITKRDAHIFVVAREQLAVSIFQILKRQIWNHGPRRMLRDMPARTRPAAAVC